MGNSYVVKLNRAARGVQHSKMRCFVLDIIYRCKPYFTV